MIDWLKARIVEVVLWFWTLAVEVFRAAWDMVTDVLAWAVEQTLEVVVSLLGALDLSALQTHAAAWGSLPADVLNVMGLLGVGSAAGIIVAAVGIRLVLQLIPFTRLGS